jgi:hypothetical protein
MNAARPYAQYLLSQRPPKSGSTHLPDYVLQSFASLPFLPSPFKNHPSISPPLLSIDQITLTFHTQLRAPKELSPETSRIRDQSSKPFQRQYNAAPEGRSFRSLRQSQMLSRYRLFVKASRSRHEMLSMAEAHNMRGLADRGYFSALRTNLLGRTRDSNHTYCYYDVEGMRY